MFTSGHYEYSFVLGIVFFLVFIRFFSFRFFSFYFLFELVFLFLFLFLVRGGTYQGRFQAGYYMLFYTLIVSLPLLIYFLSFVNMGFHGFIGLEIMGELWRFLFFFVFLVKLPVYGVHLWLPKAHVEAPLPGRIILAGVLLKLGIYGLSRLFVCLKHSFLFRGSYFFSLSVWGRIYSCILRIRQVDSKSLVAYSSVNHMCVCLGSLITWRETGKLGCFMIGFIHGIISPIIFFLVYIVYKCLNRRRIFVFRGILKTLPVLSIWWVLISACNFSFPPRIGFFSEILIIYSLSSFEEIILFLILIIIIFGGGVYRIYFFCFVSHGETTNHFFFFWWKFFFFFVLLVDFCMFSILCFLCELIQLALELVSRYCFVESEVLGPMICLWRTGFFIIFSLQGFVFFFLLDSGVEMDLIFLTLGSVRFSMTIVFDYVSLGFFSCVSLVRGAVFIYCIFYIEGTLDCKRFIILLTLFVFSIIILVFSGGIILSIVGWDGLGLVSFFLVIFYANHRRLYSGLLTVFTNRIGDAFLLVSFSFFCLDFLADLLECLRLIDFF